MVNMMRSRFMVCPKMALASIGTAMLVSGSFAFADDLPVLPKGMWEYTRIPMPAEAGVPPRNETALQVE